MIVLDTNVISVAMRRDADPLLGAWLENQPADSVWLTTISVFEIRFGIELLASGRRRRQLEHDFASSLVQDFQGRILPLDEAAAETAAALAAQRRKIGRPMEVRDSLIAGIVASRRAALATRNVRHFEDLKFSVTNPWGD